MFSSPFLLLLPSTDTDGGAKVAEAVRVAISAIRVTGTQQHITASAGVATLPRDAGDSLTLFRAADRALYAAKDAGRNRVHIAGGRAPDELAGADAAASAIGVVEPDA